MNKWTKVDAATAERIVRDAAEDVAVVWRVAPADQGQIVEVAYAGLGEAGLMERTTDRSDGSVTFRFRDWIDADEDTPALNFRPA